MRGGIITYFWSNNIGALIQSISLREFLKNKITPNFQFETYIPNELVVREKNSQLKTLNPIKYFKAYKKNLYLDNWKKKIANLPDYITQKGTNIYDKDFYIYGSDEIWNYKNPFFNYDDYYYGQNNNKKKIAYAASVGNLDLKNENIPLKVKENIRSFKKITVRDNNTFEFVKIITGKETTIVCDPSFLITPEIISGNNSKYFDILNKKKFIMIYGLYFSKKQINVIKRYSKKNNLKIISVCYYNLWADFNFLSVDPNEFIQILKSSSFVITSMFHGIMLSYKNKKNFWFSLDPYRKNKIDFFLDKFKLRDRLLVDLNDEKINFEKDKNNLDDWINLSKEQLLGSFSY